MFSINDIFIIFSAFLKTAEEKVKTAIYTSDMDTEKEAKEYRKHRAKRIYSSSESEEEQYINTNVPSPPHLPPKSNYK